jgi:hypothetical protein
MARPLRPRQPALPRLLQPLKIRRFDSSRLPRPRLRRPLRLRALLQLQPQAQICSSAGLLRPRPMEVTMLKMTAEASPHRSVSTIGAEVRGLMKGEEVRLHGRVVLKALGVGAEGAQRRRSGASPLDLALKRSQTPPAEAPEAEG